MAYGTVYCKGFSSSAHDLNDLCSKYDVVLLQELWLDKNELSHSSSFHPHFLGHGVSPVDPSAGILKGKKLVELVFYGDNHCHNTSKM